MEKCTPCEIASKEILLISKQRAIEQATTYGKERGLRLMAVGICKSGDKERYTFAEPGNVGELKQVEFISVPQ